MGTATAQSRKTLERAGALRQKGDLAGAESLYRSILRRDAGAVEALHGLALVYARQGRLEEARQHLDRALGLEPARAELHFHRAEIAGALGLTEHALESYGEALALRPDYFEVLVNMADALLQLGRPGEALERLERALGLRPDEAAALNNRGNALQALKRHEEALQCFARVLEHLPGHADVLNNQASALLSLGRYAEAEHACREALAQRADHVPAMLNLGRAQAAQGRPEDALSSYDAALALRPEHVDGWRERAALLAELRRDREAGESLRKLVAMDADAWSDWAGLAAIELRLNRPQEALDASDRALQLEREHAAPWAVRAMALQGLGRDAQAASAYNNAFFLDGNAPYVEGCLASLRLAACDWESLAAATGRILRGVRAGEPVAEPYWLLHLTASAEEQLAGARNFARVEQPRPRRPLWNGERYGHDRIRVAYLLGELLEDSRSEDLAALLEGHGRGRFEVYGILRPAGTPGPAAARVAAALEHRIESRDATDLDLAKLLRQHEIDIAVDMRSAVEAGRSAIFALRPCPVQVTGWSFPGTLGDEGRDYLFADAHVIPPGLESCYAEKPVRLPDAFLARDAARSASLQPPSRSELGLPEGRAAVLGAFHDAEKITPDMFGVWLDVLSEVEHAVLWLADAQGSMPANLRRQAQARGLDPARLVFAPAVDPADRLARIRQADVALDTLPFNDASATADMLSAGVPVIACSGDAFAARMSESLLHAAGMPELVTTSLDEYKALAIRLAREPSRLDEAKRKLAANRITQPLFDPGRFCRHAEAAYEVMYRRYQAAEPPAAFAVEAIAAVRA